MVELKMIEELICEKLNVKSKSELVGYTTGKDLGIYRKSDVFISKTNKEEFIKHGNCWQVNPKASIIEINEDLGYWNDLSNDIIRELNLKENYNIYFQLWNFAYELHNVRHFLKI